MSFGLYALLPKERVGEVLQTLCAVTGQPTALLDEAGGEQLRFGTPPDGCTPESDKCRRCFLRAGLRAQELGEAYLFSCCGDRVGIAFSLVRQEERLATVILGPFVLDEEEGAAAPGAALTPAKAQQYKKLTEQLLSPLLPSAQAQLSRTREKMSQQARLSEVIHLYKAQELTPDHRFFYDKEAQLLAKVRSGNVQEAKGLLNELIGQVLFGEGGELSAVRLHAIELTTLLSRVAMDGGARTDSIVALDKQFLTLMTQEQSVEELCLLLQDVVERFADAMFCGQDKGNPHIRRALRYMADNFDQPLTLTAVASAVGLSPAYLSALFKATVGVSFKEHLSRIRVEESKRLLLSSDCPLSDIAVAMGFPDQSYYCKVFRRICGLSPGRFRRCGSEPAAAVSPPARRQPRGR